MRRTSSARFIAIAEKMWCRAPRLMRKSATARCASSSHPSQHVAQPITSSSWSSPWPTTSPPASASRAHDVEVTGGRGPVHRVGVVALLARVDVEPALRAADRPSPRAAVLRARRAAASTRTACLRACSFSGCSSSSVASLSTSPLRAASNSWPSTVSESTCALSARQLGKPYCFARSNCASASCAVGFARRSSSRRALRLLAKPVEVGIVRQRARAGRRLAGLFGHGTFLSFERDVPFRAARCPQCGARNRRL